MLMFVALVCAALMVSCGGEKKSDDKATNFEGMWRLTMLNGNVEIILTLNGNGKGEGVKREGSENEGTFVLNKWFYDKDKNALTFVMGGEILDLVIKEDSAGGEKFVVATQTRESYDLWDLVKIE